MNQTQTIARNSFWFGVETAISLVSGIGTSIWIARSLGPELLGHYTYAAWLVALTGNVGSLGIPAATGKYMAEYLGKGDSQTAAAILRWTWRIQFVLASLLTCLLCTAVFVWAAPEMRLTSLLLAVAMWPAVVVAIPSQANVAREDLFANVPGGVASSFIYIAGVTCSMLLHWGTVGLAATLLVMRMVELVIRSLPLITWLRKTGPGVLPGDLRIKLVQFSKRGTLLLLLSIIVWDRSEVFFLRYFSDVRQLAFYTVAFNLTERLRVLPQAFTAAVGASIMAQFGRDSRRLVQLSGAAVRMLALLCIPLSVGLALLSAPLMGITYGDKYLGTAPLLSLAALLAIPRIVLSPLTSVLNATEKQHLLLRLNLAVAAINLTLDFLLIPKFGAMGAVIANGLAQTLAALGIAHLAHRGGAFCWPAGVLLKTAVAAASMVLGVIALPVFDSEGTTVLVRFVVCTLLFLLSIRAVNAISDEDGLRFLSMVRRLPSALRPWASRCVLVLVPSLKEVTANS
jgi:O-antigen/teichoic acid export membrane protein